MHARPTVADSPHDLAGSGLKEAPGYWNKGISQGRLSVDNSKNKFKKINFVQCLNIQLITLNWNAQSSSAITADETHSNLISVAHCHTNSYHNNIES